MIPSVSQAAIPLPPEDGDDTDVPEFGRWLKVQRALWGWSQRDLARESGVTQATISRFESGEREVDRGASGLSLGVVHRLATALRVPVLEVLTAAHIERYAGLSPAAVQLAYDFESLGGEEERAEVLRAVAAALTRARDGAQGAGDD